MTLICAGTKRWKLFQRVTADRKPADGDGEDFYKFLEPTFDPFFKVAGIFAQQQGAANAAPDAVRPACNGKSAMIESQDDHSADLFNPLGDGTSIEIPLSCAQVTPVDGVRGDLADHRFADAKRPSFAERSDQLAVAMTKGDADAFRDFILLHRPLARYLSRSLVRSYGVDADDAEQIGVIGLIEAARRFDPERGFQFSTYATHWVHHTCKRLGLEAALVIRLPIRVSRTFFPLRRRIKKIAADHGPGSASDELARLSALDRQFFRQWLRVERALSIRSLSDPGQPEYFEAKALAAPIEDGLLQDEVRKERIECLRGAIGCLGDRQQRLVRLRYGLNGEPQTPAQIGQSEGITQKYTRQLLNEAERRLRFLVERGLRARDPATRMATVGSRAEIVAALSGCRWDHSPDTTAASSASVTPGMSALAPARPQAPGVDVQRDQKRSD